MLESIGLLILIWQTVEISNTQIYFFKFQDVHQNENTKQTNQPTPEMQLPGTKSLILWWKQKRTRASGVCRSSREQASQWIDTLMRFICYKTLRSNLSPDLLMNDKSLLHTQSNIHFVLECFLKIQNCWRQPPKATVKK